MPHEPGFRSSFLPAGLGDRDLRLLVIGYRHPFHAPTANPQGSPDWFCFHFHQAMVVATAAGRQRLPAHSLVVHPPGSPILHQPVVGERYLRSWLRLGGAGVGTLITRSGHQRDRPVAVGHADAVTRWLPLLRTVACEQRDPDLATLRDLIAIWLRSSRASSTASEPPAGVVRVRRHLEERYREDVSLGACAELAGCSPSQLGRLFRRHYACSPIAYLLRLRLDHAAELLRFSDAPVGVIAELCGFAQLGYFSRCFKRHRGCTPSAYRQRLRS